MGADTNTGLAGQFLIAMPGMGDPRFARSVVFLCAHSDDGAMGLIVNKPAPDLDFADLLEQLGITPGAGGRAIRVHIGGPVETGRGFVLHSGEYAIAEATLKVDERFGMTATLDILEDISQGEGPADCLLALGYAGWGPGQLEAEIARNGWLTCPARPEIVFATPDERKWAAALQSMGISPSLLSAEGGRA